MVLAENLESQCTLSLVLQLVDFFSIFPKSFPNFNQELSLLNITINILIMHKFQGAGTVWKTIKIHSEGFTDVIHITVYFLNMMIKNIIWGVYESYKMYWSQCQ